MNKKEQARAGACAEPKRDNRSRGYGFRWDTLPKPGSRTVCQNVALRDFARGQRACDPIPVPAKSSPLACRKGPPTRKENGPSPSSRCPIRGNGCPRCPDNSLQAVRPLRKESIPTYYRGTTEGVSCAGTACWPQ